MLVAILCSALTDNVWGDELFYTLDGTKTATGNAYASASNVTQNEMTWSVVANTEQNPWRIGGKGLSGVDREIKSTTAMGSAITKVTISVGATASSLTVNSVKLIVASDASFNTVLDEITKTSDLTSTTLTFNPTSDSEWDTEAYYKIIFNVTRTGTSGNGYVTFNNAQFYNSGSSNPVQLSAPELTATAGNNTVTLEWNSINNASSYTIQYADNDQFTGATTITEATSPKEISGLTNGTTYYFKAMVVGDGTNYLSSDYGSAVSATPTNVSKITITQNELTDFTNAYNWYDWTVGGVSGKAYAYKNSGMQFNSGKDGYWIYNSTAIPGIITSVKIVKASGTDRSWTLKAGTSEISSTSDGTQIGDAKTVGTSGATWEVNGSYNYFLLYVSGGSTVISSIEITYTPSTDPIINATDPAELAYDATGGEFGYSITNPTSATLSATSNSNWITIVSVDGKNSKVSFSTSMNTGAQRQGTITLSYTGADDKVITITQAGKPAPSITANDVEIVYNATGGSIAYTVENPDNGTLSASVPQGSWVTLGQGTASPISFTCEINPTAVARTTTVTLTYTYDTNKTATKEVTVTQAGNPDLVDNISDITAVSTSYKVRGTVVATNSKGFVIGDGTGYVYTYLNSAPSQSIGEKVTIDGTTASYGHILQFTSSATITEATSSNYDNTPAITIVDATAIATYNSDYQLSDYVQFEGTLTTSVSGNYTNYNISVGTATARISYPTATQATALDNLVNKKVRVKGYFAGFSSSSFTVMMESVEEVVVTTPTITIDSNEFELTAGAEDGYLEIAYSNLTINSANDFSVQFYDAQGNPLASGSEPDWIDAEVTTQTGETGYFVYYLTSENTGAARTAYFKVYAEDDQSNLVYSNLVTVTQAAPVVDYATLPFSYDGNGATASEITGFTATGLGTYSDSPAIKFDTTGDNLILKLGGEAGTLSFDIENKGSGTWSGTFKVQTSANGTDYSDIATYTALDGKKSESFYLDSYVRYIKWVFVSKTTGFNVAIGNINVVAGYVKAVSSNGWATWIAPRDVEVPTDVTAYMVENTTETSASLKELLTIPANEPVLLKNEGSYEFPVASEILDNVSGNLLSVSDGTIAAGKVAYVLAKNGDTACFKKWTGEAATLNGRVVMIVDEAAAPARGFFTLDDDDNTTTGIDNVNVNLNDNNVYDLQGRCVAQPAKGLYIVNGKKVIIK